MTNKPFWEDQYSRRDGFKTFNDGNPTAEVKKLVNEYLRSGKAVDLECGAGRDSLFLAKNGFNVTAIDISASGIAKLKEVAAENKITINAEVKDIREFNFIEEYDLIISMGCLHLISKSDQIILFDKIKNHTKQNGFNSINVFTNEVPVPPDMKPFFAGLFNKGELFVIYRDWDIIDKLEYQFKDDHGNGIHHLHAGHKLIARKR